jgi:hypothetical protein
VPIYQQIEREYSIINFVEARKLVDNGSRNFSEIYEELTLLQIITEEQKFILMKREVELEIENSFPVQVNMDRVKDGDILISDMYLPATVILQLVRSAGLNKQVSLYQSNGDKSQNIVWSKFDDKHTGIHLGDNIRSDYLTPIMSNIKAEHFNPATDFNFLEKSHSDNGLTNIARLCREVRLRNNLSQKNKFYFDVACSLNLPCLFVIAELIHRKYQGRNLVFLGRDCQLLHKIYNSYYDVTIGYLPFSRQVAYAQKEEALNYLRVHSPKNPLFVDISSTGGTWEWLGNDINILTVIYSDNIFYSTTKPTVPNGFEWLLQQSTMQMNLNLLIEVVNCGDHGKLKHIEVFQDKLMRCSFDEPELPKEIVNSVHKPINDSIALAKFYRQEIREELSNLSMEQLFQMLAMFSIEICKQSHLMMPLEQFFSNDAAYCNSIKEVNKNE